MKALTPEMANLLESLCLGELSPADAQRLEELVESDEDFCRHYVLFMHMHALAERFVGADVEREARLLEAQLLTPKDVPSVPLPLPSSPVLGTLDGEGGGIAPPASFGMSFPLLMLAVLCVFGLSFGSIGLWSRVSVASRVESIGRITRMIDCQWADPDTAVVGLPPVSLGQKYSLASGLIEITYNTGVKVVLQGPVVYEADSRDGGVLYQGKLTGIVPTKTPRGFAVRTPVALITNPGADFGIEVNKAKITTVHVFRGTVELASAEKGGRQSTMLLAESESVEVIPGLEASATVRPIVGNPESLVRRLSAQPVPIKTFNTGVGVAEGQSDPHWQLVAVSGLPDFTPQPAVVTHVPGSWMPNEPGRSQWISMANTIAAAPDGTSYTYRTTFDLVGSNPKTATLQGWFAAGDQVEAIRLNGHEVLVPRENGTHSDPQEVSKTAEGSTVARQRLLSGNGDRYKSLPRSTEGGPRPDRFRRFVVARGFVEGLNVLEIQMKKGSEVRPGQMSGNSMGLRVELDGTAIQDGTGLLSSSF